MLSGHHIQRFWSKVDIRGPEDCWPWKAHRNAQGYGHFKHFDQLLAHRVALEEHLGRPLGSTLALHSCDNPSCCNPAHLREGNNQDNNDDMVKRNRCHRFNGTRRGSGNPHAKISESDVLAIRRDARGVTALAKEYGLSPSYLSQVKSGKRWTHV